MYIDIKFFLFRELFLLFMWIFVLLFVIFFKVFGRNFLNFYFYFIYEVLLVKFFEKEKNIKVLIKFYWLLCIEEVFGM